jgi:hypothetical protein
MAAPEYVPVKPLDDVRTYASPPRRPDQWRADRPGDLDGAQPRGNLYGSQGPDQGYVLTLVPRFEGRLHLHAGDDPDDVTAGVVAIAMKRASLFGRAPMIHDLTAAYTIWGLLDAEPPKELVELRKRVFAGVANPNHWLELRRLVDGVPESTLRRSHTELSTGAWRDLLDVASYDDSAH